MLDVKTWIFIFATSCTMSIVYQVHIVLSIKGEVISCYLKLLKSTFSLATKFEQEKATSKVEVSRLDFDSVFECVNRNFTEFLKFVLRFLLDFMMLTYIRDKTHKH
jgi:hypothetical protein